MATRTLNIELIGALGLKDTEFIGKSDPYAVLSIGKTERKSAVAKDQAAAPSWNETFTLPVLETDTELLVRILNDDTLGKDEEMGRTVIPLSLIHGGSHSASTFPLELKGKPQGEIKLSLSFEGEGHREHQESSDHGLSEKVQGLFVGGEKDHDDEHKHELHHIGHKHKERKGRKERKSKGSGNEGGSSSSDSDSDKGE